MARPGELLRRAKESRRSAQAARTQAREAVQPAPALQPHHGAYTALMRSHDRLRTRHLPVQGGARRA